VARTTTITWSGSRKPSGASPKAQAGHIRTWFSTPHRPG
jgi:hypothetical protein